MKLAAIIFISFWAAIAQLTLMSKLAVWSVTPNLVLAGILTWVIFRSPIGNIWLVLWPAFWLDLLVGQPLGLFTLAVCLTIFFVDWLSRSWFKKNDWSAFFSLSFSGILFFEICQVLTRSLAVWLNLGNNFGTESFYFYALLPLGVLANGIVCLIFIWLLNSFKFLKTNG